MKGAAAKATDAAEDLLVWLRSQPQGRFRPPNPAAPLPGSPADQPGADIPKGAAGPDTPGAAAPAPVPSAPASGPGVGSGEPAVRTGGVPEQEDRHAPLRLAHTDWLHHRLRITGPKAELARFREAACGAGTVPWQLDLDRMAEDFFHLLAAPPPRAGFLHAPPRSLGLKGARIVADRLITAVARRHALAVARVGNSRACPFDLHVLVPVPEVVLRLGPDDPAALAWLWQHWGTTQTLRQVAEDTGAAARGRPAPGEAVFAITFWSADWTPWRALASIAATWPGLRFDTSPRYDAP
jgi:hypothetical protein